MSRRKAGKKKEKPERKKAKWENKNLRGGPHGHPGDYAAELGPLLLLGRRSETGAGWLGDAGEYCGETRENCDAVVLTNCEYCGETGENCEAGVRSNCEP